MSPHIIPTVPEVVWTLFNAGFWFAFGWYCRGRRS